MATEKTAVLIIRAWIQRDSPTPLRANIRRTTDVSAGFLSTLNLTTSEAVGQVVSVWLHDIAEGNVPPT